MTTPREIEAGAAALRRHDSASENQELPDCPSYYEDARVVLTAAAGVRGHPRTRERRQEFMKRMGVGRCHS